ncbi:hypothetical protein SDC9_164971 [bioreactor metagenome]|uniref:Uncharacterized protein n=1 Tax=bioreactor metagenome TaxID=1076179 RepID=A0A645FUZ4_9ZZZZ
MLGNTARFFCSYIARTNRIKQRGLTMIHVTHNGYHRSTRKEFFFGIIGIHNDGFRVKRLFGCHHTTAKFLND